MDLDKLREHKLFPCRMVGNALVVEPSGSLASYGRTIIDTETGALVRAVEEGGIQVMIINLSKWNYFGSEMVGLFFQLRKTIGEETRIVICGASPDMATILETMQVHQVFPIYPTEKEALREVATLTLRDHLPSRRYMVPVIIVGIVLLVGVIGGTTARQAWRRWSAQLIGSQDVKLYQRLLGYYNDLRRMRAAQTSQEEWNLFTTRVRDRLSGYISSRYEQGATDDVDRLLYSAALSLMKIVESDPTQPDYDQELANSLDSAARLLEQNLGVMLERAPRD